jgi:hypothetical protein
MQNVQTAKCLHTTHDVNSDTRVRNSKTICRTDAEYTNYEMLAHHS